MHLATTSYAHAAAELKRSIRTANEHMFGTNAMDLSLRPPAARAGYDQGGALSEQLAEFWR